MKNNIQKIIYPALTSVLLILIGFLAGRLFYTVSNEDPLHYSLVKPLVYDATTGVLIEGASVTSAESGITYVTDGTGSTDWIPLYYSSDEELVLSTFIASASGYKTTLLYMAAETGKDPLNGPLIYMFPGDNSSSVSIVSAPSDEYSKKLRERFR